jgi:hypothetical protein
MDLEVHRAVLASGARRTGATVHFVEATVDGGEVVAQESLDVVAGESAEALKARVQPLEGPLFVAAVKRLQRNLQLLPCPALAGAADASPEAGTAAESSGPITYRAAGVDIDAGDELVARIKPACSRTKRSGCFGAGATARGARGAGARRCARAAALRAGRLWAGCLRGDGWRCARAPYAPPPSLSPLTFASAPGPRPRPASALRSLVVRCARVRQSAALVASSTRRRPATPRTRCCARARTAWAPS